MKKKFFLWVNKMSDYFREGSENKKYNDEFLQTSLTLKKTKRIVEKIIKIMDETTKDDFCVIDVYAGIGTTSLVFLDEDKIGQVISFTTKEKRKMLRENINDEKSSVESTKFNFPDLNIYKGCTLFINTLEKKDSEEIRKIIEDYSENVYMFYIYIENPNDLEIETDLERIDGKSYVIFKNDEDKFSSWGVSDMDENPNVNFEKQIKWKEFCNGLKSKGKEWKLKNFQAYIKSVLIHITGTAGMELVNEMISPKNMEIWTQAITHESIDLNANFETLETYGDNLLAYSMSQYLRKRFPDIQAQGLTEYKSRYMSKEFQGKFTKQMKLTSWIKAEETYIGNKIEEDVFESFSGALLTISNSILEGLGPIYVLNFLTLVLSDTEFDRKWLLGKPKTQLQQRGNMLKILKNEIFDEDEDEDEDGKKEKMKGGISDRSYKNGTGYTTNIILSDELISFLKKNLNREFVRDFKDAESFGVTKDNSVDNAWKKAYDILEKNGYTEEFTTRYVEKRMFDDLDKNLVEEVKEKLKTMNYDHLSFRKPKNARDAMMFIGKKGDILTKLSIAQGTTPNLAKEAALEKFLEN